MPECLLQSPYHFWNGIDNLVLARKSRIHLIFEVVQTVLEVVEGFIMKLYITNSLHSLNFRCELNSESVYFCSSFIFRFLSSFYSFNCSFSMNSDSLIFPMFSFSLFMRDSFYFSSPSLSSELYITYCWLFPEPISFLLRAERSSTFSIRLDSFWAPVSLSSSGWSAGRWIGRGG